MNKAIHAICVEFLLEPMHFKFFPRYILTFTSLLASLCQAQTDGKVQLSARLAADEIPINREALLVVEARWAGKPGEISIESIAPPKLTNLKLTSTATSNQVLKENNELVTLRRYEFYLKGETLGMAYIDEAKLKYQDKDGDEYTLRTARMQLKIVDPVSEPQKNARFEITFGGIVLLIAAAIGLILRNEKQKKRAREAYEANVAQSLEERYREKLQKTVDLHADDLTDEYNILSTLLRNYINDSLALESTVRTTQELVEQLHAQQIEMNKVTTIQEILQACDLVKFSGGSADPNQIARLYTLFEELLRKPQAFSSQVSDVSKET